MDARYFGETNLMFFEDALHDPCMAMQKMRQGQMLPNVQDGPRGTLRFPAIAPKLSQENSYYQQIFIEVSLIERGVAT